MPKKSFFETEYFALYPSPDIIACKAGVFSAQNHDTFFRTKILDIETNRELGQVKNLFQGRGLWA